MIHIPTDWNWKCDRLPRREFLRLGALGALGLNLPQLLKANDLQGRNKREISCMLLWLSGGPSQLETFDPKPEAPAEIRGEFKTIPTHVPGVHFSEYLPKLAKNFDKFSLLRSMTHAQGTHGLADQLVTSGYPPTPSGVGIRFPSQGSIVSHLVGYRDGIPPYVYIGDVGGPDDFRKRDALNAGVLGATHNPLALGDKANDSNFAVKDLVPAKGVNYDRLNSRREMLKLFDKYHKTLDTQLPPLAAVDTYYEKAYSLVTSPRVKRAFEIDQESSQLRDAYGRTMFGQSCLLGRRLIEAGVRYVTVGMPGWDTHTDHFNSCKKLIPDMDSAYSALLQDLSDRGLLDTTLVLCLGEFGRTPKVNGQAGRDHWPSTQVVAMGGGGIKTGIVVGETSERSEYPTERPLSVKDFCATVYHVLGIATSAEYVTAENRPIKVLDGGEPIQELI